MALVSFWQLNETSGNRADGYGTNTLTDNNTVTNAAGLSGTAALFTSANSEFLSVADVANLRAGSAFSIDFWAYHTTVADDQTYFAKWTYQTQGEYACQVTDTNEIIFFAAAALDSAGGENGRTTDLNLAAETWYHIACVYNGAGADNAGRMQIYVNGAAKTLSFNGTIPASVAAGTGDFNLGKFGGTLDRYFNGRMQYGSFWSHALTAGEVTARYNGGTPVSPASWFGQGAESGMVRGMIRNPIGVPVGGIS